MDNRFISPHGNSLGVIENALANCEALRTVRRAILGRLPFPVLTSEVRDVIYANWIVPIDRVAAVIPEGVRIIERQGRTVLTVLSYAHGHFGPAMASFMRRLFPSPLQSNWRLYVSEIEGVGPARPTVLFLKNVFDSPIYALGTRIGSDALPSHLAGRFIHQLHDGAWETGIEGPGSAPEWHLRASDTREPCIPANFADFFGGWNEAVVTLALQDEAIAVVEDIGQLACAQIDLPVDMRTVEPMVADDFVPGALLREWGATEKPFCFRVPAVRFRVLSERLLPAPRLPIATFSR